MLGIYYLRMIQEQNGKTTWNCTTTYLQMQQNTALRVNEYYVMGHTTKKHKLK